MVKGSAYSSGGRGGRTMATISTADLEAEQERFKGKAKNQRDILNNTEISDPYLAADFKKSASANLSRSLGILGANQKELNKRAAQGQEPKPAAKKPPPLPKDIKLKSPPPKAADKQTENYQKFNRLLNKFDQTKGMTSKEYGSLKGVAKDIQGWSDKMLHPDQKAKILRRLEAQGRIYPGHKKGSISDLTKPIPKAPPKPKAYELGLASIRADMKAKAASKPKTDPIEAPLARQRKSVYEAGQIPARPKGSPTYAQLERQSKRYNESNDKQFPGRKLDAELHRINVAKRRGKLSYDDQHKLEMYSAVKAQRTKAARDQVRNKVIFSLQNQETLGKLSKAKIDEHMKTYGLKPSDLGALSKADVYAGKYHKPNVQYKNPEFKQAIEGYFTEGRPGNRQFTKDHSTQANRDNNVRAIAGNYLYSNFNVNGVSGLTNVPPKQAISRLNKDYYRIQTDLKDKARSLLSDYKTGKITQAQARKREIAEILPLKTRMAGINLATKEIQNKEIYKNYLKYKADPSQVNKGTGYNSEQFFKNLDASFKAGKPIGWGPENMMASSDYRARGNKPSLFPDVKIALPPGRRKDASSGISMTADEKKVYKEWNGDVLSRGYKYHTPQPGEGSNYAAQSRRLPDYIKASRIEKVRSIATQAAEVTRERAAIKKYSGKEAKSLVYKTKHGDWKGPDELTHISIYSHPKVDVTRFYSSTPSNFKTRREAIQYTDWRLKKAKENFSSNVKRLQESKRKFNDPKTYAEDLKRSKFYDDRGHTY